ncbi:glycosyltransferase [Lysobacter auxotrophicus]|uniref:Glycosyltransferase n=1 Tax=Lysobacter auxotrophicus TaxID=2992573 RepID=A0ABM8DBX7_9GAMM|nr:glycosyltransferase [Lysobacter auxotrophicus]BDU16085.1 glycosyltransferase [Lysobacter auxotrophicus]
MNELRPFALQVRSSAGLYGADRVVLALNRALDRSGARSRLLSINNYRMSEQALHDIASTRGQDAVLLPCRGRVDASTIGALAAQVGAARDRAGLPPVVHVHDYKSAFYAWIATRREHHAAAPAPLVATLHGWVEGSTALRLYTRLELALLRRFDALVVVAAEQIDRLARAGVPRSRIRHIGNGIEYPVRDESAATALRTQLRIAPDAHVFSAVARLSSEKNLAMLLRAFACVANRQPLAVLLVVGDGPEREELEALAHSLALNDRVHFLGMRHDMPAIYTLTDHLVLPSLTEGMPLVVLEAMACEVPVIASAVGDIPRLLEHAAHGRTIPPGDAAALESALEAALAAPRTRDVAARDHVRERHGAQAMAADYVALYRDLLEKRHARRAS